MKTKERRCRRKWKQKRCKNFNNFSKKGIGFIPVPFLYFTMMRFLVLFILSGLWLDSQACHCDLNQTDLKQSYAQFGFIAHVKIVQKEALSSEDTTLVNQGDVQSHYSKITIEVIELYKGTADIKLLEWGIHTSCDMGIRVNQEWIFFGNYLNKSMVAVSFCNPWSKLKESNGERYWQYDLAVASAIELRKLAGLPEKINPTGRKISYYPDGKILANEEYSDNLLTGSRKVYFATGGLMEEASYSSGVPVGKQTKFTRDGQVSNEFIWNNGEIIYSVFWYDTSYQARESDQFFLRMGNKSDSITPARVQKQSEGWYDPITKERHSLVYNRAGGMETAHFSWKDFSFKLSCHYTPQGLLEAEHIYIRENEISLEKKWDQAGKLISNRQWFKGKLVSP